MDQDGRPDLVLALSPSGCFDNRDMVRIYPNAGEFKFGDSVDTFMEAGPQDAEVADLTGDGVPDLIAVSGYGRVGVRPGLGGFRFGDLLRFGVPGIQPRGVLVADLDHDGRLDVVTNDEAAVHVLMNRGGESRRGVRGAVQPDAQAAIAPRASRLAATVNPVSRRGEIALNLELAQNEPAVDLAVYDVSGRRVGVLARGALAAGVHHIPWTGATAGGAVPPPGLYFVRARLAAGAVTARLLLLP